MNIIEEENCSREIKTESILLSIALLVGGNTTS